MSDSPALDAARTAGEQDRDGVPGILRSMARDIGDRLARIEAQLNALPRIESAISDLNKRVAVIERRVDRHDDRLDAHEGRTDGHELRIAALEKKG